MELEKTTFPLAQWLEDTVGIMRSAAQDQDTEITYQLAQSVPGHVIGDPTRLRQVITNLLSNAIKFCKGGRVSVDVSCLSSTSDNGSISLLFAVTDTGIGIPVDKQKSIFQPFTQADFSTTRKYGGTGLGLTIVSRLVELMGGTISLQSEVGKGSTFSFSVEVEAGNTQPVPQMGALSVHKFDAGKPLNILLAEDNLVNQKVAQGLLGKHGHQIVIAANGIEAVDAFKQSLLDPSRSFDVILMDVHMPEMDGYEATALIRELEAASSEHGRIPIIALTANASEADRQRCLDAKMDDFVSKPFKMADLAAVLTRLTH